MPRTFTQTFIPNKPRIIPFLSYSRKDANKAVESMLGTGGLMAAEPRRFGVALRRSSKGHPQTLAVATVSRVILVAFESRKSEKLVFSGAEGLLGFLSGSSSLLVGFGMTWNVLQLCVELGMPVRGIDLSTMLQSDTRKRSLPSELISHWVSEKVDGFPIDLVWEAADHHESDQKLCLRAWITACIIQGIPQNHFDQALKLDTQCLHAQELPILAELVRQTYLLDNAQPHDVSGEFDEFKPSKGGISIRNSRYKTRVRRSGTARVIMMNNAGKEFVGAPTSTHGKTTEIRCRGAAPTGTLRSVRVVGRPELTNAEKAREQLLLHFLQGKATFRGSSFIRRLWFPTMRDREELKPKLTSSYTYPDLNPSQAKVVSAMLSSVPLVLVHGPPGTGKTTTIAAATAQWCSLHQPVWIVAQSNVAVKNIAEALGKRGVDYKLLVSNEFYVEWHEHLYKKIENRTICSDDLNVKSIIALERLLQQSTIILSTLSMLSNPQLDSIAMFRLVPVKTLVIDEASQIRLEEYIPVCVKFTTLEKICFFGDPKQLPPFGKDTVSQMKTIYDVGYLRNCDYFLDTQYRMPIPLGSFISNHVYRGKLKSVHKIQDYSSVTFVEALRSQERQVGSSWENDGEVHTLVHLVRNYYKNKNFCILTPYDPQRSRIQKELKTAQLPWEQVFNVDSFQGNEADYVLISVVRSGPKPGFLSSLNRLNVMLTRCKKGLVIVTTQAFLSTGGGKNTLIGELKKEWDTKLGAKAWISWQSISAGTADLPGAPGPNRSKSLPIGRSVPGKDVSGESGSTVNMTSRSRAPN